MDVVRHSKSVIVHPVYKYIDVLHDLSTWSNIFKLGIW